MKDEAAGAKKLFSVGGNPTIRLSRPRVRATAAATIEPMGPRDGGARREHLIKVVVELNQADAKTVDKAAVTATARHALAGYAPKAGEADRRETREVGTTRRSKTGVLTNVVVAIEGTVVWPGRPSAASMDALSASLLDEGYRVVVRERRECSHTKCATEAIVTWNQLDEVPMGWSSNLICGKHSYKTCEDCKSLYLCTSVNAAGQAPTVYCNVCGAVLIEWGRSKLWEAELVTRGDGAVAARSRKRQPGS